MARAKTRKGLESRQRIVTSACTLFYERGIAGTSVDDILNHAGMGKSQFYHYFSSKEELVCAVVDAQIERILAYLEPFSRQVRGIEDLDQWFAAYNKLARAHDCMGCPVGVIAAEAAVTCPSVAEHVMQAFHRWRDGLSQALAGLQASGDLVEDFDPNRAAEFIGTCVQGALLLTRTFRDARFLEQAAQEIQRYLALSWTPAARERMSLTP